MVEIVMNVTWSVETTPEEDVLLKKLKNNDELTDDENITAGHILDEMSNQRLKQSMEFANKILKNHKLCDDVSEALKVLH